MGGGILYGAIPSFWRVARLAHVIEMKDVSNFLGEIGALRGLSLRVEKGVLGLLRPNGAGKTTAMAPPCVADLREETAQYGAKKVI